MHDALALVQHPLDVPQLLVQLPRVVGRIIGRRLDIGGGGGAALPEAAALPAQDLRQPATPLARGAGVIMSLVKADGIVTIPRFSEGHHPGEEVTVELLRAPGGVPLAIDDPSAVTPNTRPPAVTT